MEITLGDVIGYILTFLVGIITGALGNKYISKTKHVVNQNNNNLKSGDIVGGSKYGK